MRSGCCATGRRWTSRTAAVSIATALPSPAMPAQARRWWRRACGSPLPSALPAAGREELGHRSDEDDAEQDFGSRRRVADVPALEADLVDEEHDGQRGVVGSAQSQDLRLTK